MNNVLSLLAVSAFLVAVGVGVSLLVDAIVEPEPPRLTVRLVLKIVAYVAVFQVVVEARHRLQRPS